MTSHRSTGTTGRNPVTGRSAVILLTGVVLAAAACGDDDGGAGPAETSPASAAQVEIEPAETAPPTTAPASTTVATVPSRPPPEPTSTTVEETPAVTDEEELSAQIEAVLTEAIAPGSIRWDVGGVDAPATAAVAAVRIPERDDVLVAAGENVDGTPADADAPFGVATLTESLVRTVAFQLIDEGLLDPAATVDLWVPALPNADRVTVRMLIDNVTGWSDYGIVEPDPIVSDLGRAWTLREAVEVRATAMTALDEPGVPTDDGRTNDFVLGLVVQEVGGRPLAELIRSRVADPAGLDETDLLDGSNTPADYRHGVFAFGGAPLDTSIFDFTSYVTWERATHAAMSTPTDLLDLLDAWTTGELFTTDRTPAPERYASEPVLDSDGNPWYVVGLEVPFNGFCPCAEVDGGMEPTALGRSPVTIGTTTFLYRYADGISVVVNVNSNASSPGDIKTVLDEVHRLAVVAS
jgi:CubicO group peptidase (beta-lactamase class C family)